MHNRDPEGSRLRRYSIGELIAALSTWPDPTLPVGVRMELDDMPAMAFYLRRGWTLNGNPALTIVGIESFVDEP